MASNSKIPESNRFHPYNILLTLVLGAVIALFVALSGAYIYTRIQNPSPAIQLPSLFYVTTFVLIGSSMTMIWAKRCYLSDDTRQYQLALMATLFLSLVFMVLQFAAWRQLFRSDVFMTQSTLTSYLYLICALHFAHVMAGIPVLVMFLRSALLYMKEPVSVLIYFSDPEKKLKLKLLTIYWHFLDGLWIYLMLFFWLNWYFS